jgi:uncharacterized damage-inducible protein DinB
MRPQAVLIDAYGRVLECVDRAVNGLTEAQLSARPSGGAGAGNSIAWLVWHLSRIQDDHVADAAGTEQVWTSQGFSDRFDLPFDEQATGYGQGEADVAKVKASAQLLTDYHHAVHDRTVEYLAGLSEADLDRVVDHSWDPPVTLGARLVSVISDDLQHVGQAAYARGLL